MNTFLVRRNRIPFNLINEAFALSNAMDRIVRNDGWRTTWARDWSTDAPALNVSETAENFVVKAALPGWKPEQIDISFENGVVTLKGETSEENEQKDGEKTHVREIRKNAFVRSIELTTEVEADKATAEFENGVLTLNIPKAEVVKPKQIKIAVK
jgi:HSP20 family protein